MVPKIGMITSSPDSAAAPLLAPTGGQPSQVSVSGSLREANVDAVSPVEVDGLEFTNKLSEAIAAVENKQQIADGLAQQVATGQVEDVADYMVAATQAQLATEFTVAIRNKAVSAFQTVMNMQV